jgi:hypothetical protein
MRCSFARPTQHVFTRIDLSRLSGAQTARVVMAADLATLVSASRSTQESLPDRQDAAVSRPTGVLIFEQFDAFDQARSPLRDPMRSMGTKRARHDGAFGANRFLRVAGHDAAFRSASGMGYPARF